MVDGVIRLERPTPVELLAWIDSHPEGTTADVRLAPAEPADFKTAAASEQGWDRAIREQSGVFGRVWTPDIARPTLVSVQYFIFLRFNNAVFLNAGYHDGDWLCVDFDVDMAAPARPLITGAFFHFHGAQMRVDADALSFEGGHPVVWLEQGGNEPWPFPGPGGMPARWPAGVVANRSFPNFVIRRHDGTGGHRYAPSSVVRLADDTEDVEANLVMKYPGKWGGSDDSPPGPPFQAAIWLRRFKMPASNVARPSSGR